MLKVYYLPTLGAPICYWRVENYANQLLNYKDCAVFVEYFYDPNTNQGWEPHCLNRNDTGKHIQVCLREAFKAYDVIIIQKLQHKESVSLIKKLKEEFPDRTVLAEIDDSIGDVTPSNYWIDQWDDHHHWAAEFLNIVDGVIASTEYLRQQAIKINPRFNDKNTFVAPNCIHPASWTAKKSTSKGLIPKQDGEFRIGYVGGGGHDEDIRMINWAMKEILEIYPFVTFYTRYGGLKPDSHFDHERVNFESVGCHISEYPQMLSNLNLDLALAPLRDTDFNRCKSNLKWIEWAYSGVPLLASNVEPYSKTDGSIYLCDNDHESWIGALKGAIKTRDFLPTGKELRQECKRNYSIHKNSRALLKFLNSMI